MSLLTKLARYNKFIVAVLGAISVGLTTFGHGQPWIATLLSAISAISVYFVPNKQPTVPVGPVSMELPIPIVMSGGVIAPSIENTPPVP
jgi:hypothetical protein